MNLPAFNDQGDLPPGVHRATLQEVLERFGQGSVQRFAVGKRLKRSHQLANSTNHLARFVVFGSFVTDKFEPEDVDVIMIMEDEFDLKSSQAKPRSCSSTWKRMRTLVRVYFGLIVLVHSAARMQ